MTDMTESEYQDRIEELADRILDRCNRATKAKNGGDPAKAGELFGDAADLTGQVIQLLDAAEADRSRIEDWRAFRAETRRESENLLADGESDVDMQTVFDIPELSPNLAVTTRNTEATPERNTFEAERTPSGEVELDETPSWEPAVAVAGVGPTGAKTVGAIDTGSAAQIYSSPSPGDVADSDFLFLSADLRESGVPDRVSDLLAAAGDDTCVVFFAEGRTGDPGAFVDAVNLLFPVAVTEGDGRQFVSTAIADCFECMLRPTVRELGKGDVAAVAGTNRVGKVFVDNWADTSQLGDLTPGPRLDAPDAVLLFVCYDGPYPAPAVETKVREYERPDDAAFLWDPRTSPRYRERAHLKRVLTADTDRQTMRQLLHDDGSPGR
ncbi:hypothetical protein [Halosimplex halophilum]|uniref:hypothetical protein n=1 Tax=Halosimplex halophilum TaxID=2559572 RepID=UPI0014355A12|nr:hypothetical protein [Halosimplex halophilum]